MNRLSTPFTEIKSAYDVVVIGSGYGGGIAASRMARCGRKVCLLEKGKEFSAGEFPSNLIEASKEMQVNTMKKHIGPANGLYEFVVGEGISVFKGCGLGGTSLVNANVSIEAESRVFEDACWPDEIRNNMQSLEEGIGHAREMLKPNPYPEGKNGYPVLSKTQGMRKSAASMEEEFRLLDINVTFEDKRNHVGVEQKKCINCGDCVTGCNYEAKNTTYMNYLPDAKNHGTEIFTEIDVRHIERKGDKWLVFFDVCNTGRQKFDAPDMFIKADMVFVCGGSVGSTEILLRSAVNGLDISDKLGKNFTGNGDVLGFGYNCDVPINGIGRGDKVSPPKIENVGPCITSIIDARHKTELTDGMTIEEGSIPGPIRSILIPVLLPLSRLIGRDTDSGFVDFVKEKWRMLISLFSGPFHGALKNTQVYLVMSHDKGDGEIQLDERKKKAVIKWRDVGEQEIFGKVNDTLKNATKALGGNYVKNPSWTKMLDYELVTVHPLGGCMIGKDASSGVVDHKGQVFAGKKGKDLYPGLHVLDGSIIPRPVGTNPLLTISGLAERACKIIAEENKWNLDYTFPEIPAQPDKKNAIGIQFTETMKGYFSTNEKDDYKKGKEKGEAENSPFEFTLTIHSENVDKFLDEASHTAQMIGTVKAPKLSPQPLTASSGIFNLFVIDPSEPGVKRMNYAMNLSSLEGKDYYFTGYKEVKNDKGVDVWSDTTTLFITVYSGQDEKSPILGKGILKIELGDFAKQATTMKAINAKTNGERLKALTKFGDFFAGNVWKTYFKPDPSNN